MLAVAVAVTGIVMHAGEPGQVAVPYPAVEGTIINVILTGVLNAAYAVHGALSLTPTSSITDDTNLVLNLADGIAIFESGNHTYAAVAAPGDNGVQILNITNPSNITAAGNIKDDDENNDDLLLVGTGRIAIFESGGHTYAAVTAVDDNGVQILNITNPSNITAAGNIVDADGFNEENTDDLLLVGAIDIAIFESGGHTYAAVTAVDDNGVQILNITNPSNITAAGNITDNTTRELDGANGIAIFESSGHTYAAVTAKDDDGVQILDVTDPYRITAAGIANGTSLVLDGAWGITTFNSSGHTYAAVTAQAGHGVQILNITDPSDITAAGSITNGTSLNLNTPRGITIFESSGHTYAAVAVYRSDSVQILDVTDPYRITAAGSIMNSTSLSGAHEITTFESGGYIYAAVTARLDHVVQIIRVGSANAPPTVMAGSDLIVAEGGTLALSGSATDTDGDAITLYSWSAPPGSGITFADSSLPATTFTAPPVNADVTHTLTLTANDGTDNGTGTIEVTVKDTSGAFITTWRNDTAGESITIPVGGATGTYDVIWGDGTASAGVMGDQTHTYAVSGNHTVAISGGFERIYLNGHTNATKLASIDQWGSNQWTSMESAFEGASAMTYGATDAPDLSGVTDMSFMFAGASSFNGNISGWDVLGVTDMSDMFTSASSFNGNISGWDVSGVTDMSNMFEDADSFNRPLNGWNVSGVTDMSGMFFGTDIFNQNISGWKVSGVTDMSYMFYEAAFNGDISGWNVSGVTDMSGMFYDAYLFNQPLNDWKVSGVTDMSFMFFSADVFNQNISGWDVSEVTNMRSMFHNAGSFNQPLNDWDVSEVTDMDSMLHGANSFRQNLGKWYVNLNSTEISSAPGIVGGISAQNQKLLDQGPKYGIGAGFDESAFEITVDDEEESSLNMAVSPNKRLYRVNVTSEGGFGTNNHRILEVAVTGTFDSAAPGPTLSTDTASPTNSASATITVDFGEPIDATTFTLDDISVTGGTASGLAQEGATTQNYTFTVTPASDGQLTVTIPADSVMDLSDNNNTASDTLSITFDRIAFSPALSTSAASPTNSASATITVDFGEPIDATTFTLDDISVTGGTASGLAQEGSTTQKYTFTVAPASDGTITVTIPADSVKDLAGNNNTASGQLPVTFDRTAFSPALSTDTTSPTNSASATVTVDFGEPIDATTFTLDDISVTGGTASGLAQEGATTQNYTFTVTPASDGTITVTIPADSVKDLADNNNTASNQLSVTFDRTAFSPALSTDAASPTNSASATITVDFGEPIDATTFTLDDISVTGGTASGLAQEGATTQKYTFTVAPASDGTITVTIPADSVKDLSDNNNTASNQLSVTFDRTAFSPALSTDAASPTNSASATITVDFGEPIDATTFTLDDISVTGGTASGLAQEGATTQNYTFTVTPASDGTITVTIPADSVKDLADNNNTASNQLSVTFDRTAFSPALSTDAASPTNSASATITVDFGEPIDATTFTLDDISVTGGTASGLAQEGATTQNYTFTVTPASDGTITVTIPADSVKDLSDNNNTASNQLSVTFDRTAFSPALSTDAASPTNSASATITVDFGEPIDATTFTLDDISVTGGTASGLAQEGATTQNYTFTVTPASDGTITVTIPADRVKDLADNNNTASNQLSVTFDRTAFSPALSTDAASPTNSASATITVDFGEPIDATTFTLDDISVTGGTASGLAQEGATTQNYTFTVTPASDGTITVTIPADSVKDLSDNNNTASNQLSVTFDRTAFSPALSTDAASPTNSASATITVDFGEPIDATTFTLDDISVTGGTASGLAQEGATTQNYTFTVTPDADGEVTASIPAGRVTDPADNANTASNILSVVFDRTSPGTTDPTPGSKLNMQCLGYAPYFNNSPVVDVGEDITIAEGETGTLRATVTDMDGDDVETFWTHWKPSTAIITIADPESLVTEFTAPYVDGDTDTYVILRACDGIHTGVGNDVVRITITDIPEPPEPATPPQLPPPVQEPPEPPTYNEEPSVDAGADFTINEGATGQLQGTATDADNDPLTTEWLQTPTWPLLTLTDASDPRTTIVAPQVDGDTTITLILSVSDGDYIVPDQVRITIIDTG